MRASVSRRVRRGRHEEGQALVEFALIVPLFLVIVVGIIQFGVALNFWFDLQRLANQGARSAAVNCGTADNQCTAPTSPQAPFSELEWKLKEDVISGGNTPDLVEVCYVPPNPEPAGWTPGAGDAVRVSLSERYRLQAIVGLAKIDLNAKATMRLEQRPDSTKLPLRTDPNNWVRASNTTRCKP